MQLSLVARVWAMAYRSRERRQTYRTDGAPGRESRPGPRRKGTTMTASAPIPGDRVRVTQLTDLDDRVTYRTQAEAEAAWGYVGPQIGQVYVVKERLCDSYDLLITAEGRDLRDARGGPGGRAMSVNDVLYPQITVHLMGTDGNAFAIIGAVRAALRRGGMPADEQAAFVEEATSGDYDNVLATAMRWVEVA